jgi:hypothetical protein
MYDWKNKTWFDEDDEFAPKRRVSNKGGPELSNIIGSIYSEKMKRQLQHESLGEKLFYSLLELDALTVRYYTQPLYIDIKFLDDDGNIKAWKHVTDVLVFRQGFKPHMYQVKEEPEDSNNPKNKIIDRECLKYAKYRDWNYSVVYPKLLPEDVKYNIKYLQGYVRKRNNYDDFIPKIISMLSKLGKMSIGDFIKTFIDCEPVLLSSIIYHLIAIGTFKVDLYKKISQYSEISISEDNGYLFEQLVK